MVERGAVTWGTSDVVRVQSEDSVIMRGFSNLQNLILKQSQTQQQPKGTGFRRQQLLCLDQFGRRYGQKRKMFDLNVQVTAQSFFCSAQLLWLD